MLVNITLLAAALAPAHAQDFFEVDGADSGATSIATGFYTPGTVLTPCLDLIPVDIMGPTYAFVGSQVDVEVWVTNDSPCDSGGHFSGMYLSTDTYFDASDELLIGGREWMNIAAGNTEPMFDGYLPVIPSVAPGTYYLLGVVDEFGYLFESVTLNNVISQPIEIY